MSLSGVSVSSATPNMTNPYDGNVIQYFDRYIDFDNWWQYYGCTWWPWGSACAWMSDPVENLYRDLRFDCQTFSDDLCTVLNTNQTSLGESDCSGIYYDYHFINGQMRSVMCYRCAIVVSIPATNSVPPVPFHYGVKDDKEVCTLNPYG